MANDKKKMVEAITAQEVDFAQWYTDICTKAELVEYSSVKGFVVLRPDRKSTRLNSSHSAKSRMPSSA